MRLQRPSRIFDREAEWASLSGFLSDGGQGPRLGIVFGRRRQGKSLLTRSACLAAGGLYHVALEQESSLALRALGEDVARAQGLPAPLALPDWEAAMDAVFALGSTRPYPVVLDEFPNLLAGDGRLASIIQRAHDRATFDRSSRLRLILCGSAISVMERLMTGSAPLFGRAVLQMLLHPFDFREAAAFWGLSEQPRLAFRVHAILGGTPAYRSFAAERSPSSQRTFDGWVRDVVLDPRGTLVREPQILLAEEPGVSDRALYNSILAAIANGRTRPGEIASTLARPQTALAHPLRVLEELRLVRKTEDALRERRASYRILEPLVRFYHAVLSRHVRSHGLEQVAEAWPKATAAGFSSLVLGPHLEDLAREWTLRHASERTLGGRPAHVAPTVVNDPTRKAKHELDVVALDDRGHALAIGEAKWREVGRVGIEELRRLEEVRSLLVARDLASEDTRLLLFAPAFTPGLVGTADARTDVELVDLDRLYGGD